MHNHRHQPLVYVYLYTGRPSYRDAALEAPDLDGQALKDVPGTEPRVAVRVARAAHARVELVVQLRVGFKGVVGWYSVW